MKIQETIDKLTEIKNRYGNVDVFVPGQNNCNEYGWTKPNNIVYVAPPEDSEATPSDPLVGNVIFTLD